MLRIDTGWIIQKWRQFFSREIFILSISHSGLFAILRLTVFSHDFFRDRLLKNIRRSSSSESQKEQNQMSNVKIRWIILHCRHFPSLDIFSKSLKFYFCVFFLFLLMSLVTRFKCTFFLNIFKFNLRQLLLKIVDLMFLIKCSFFTFNLSST